MGEQYQSRAKKYSLWLIPESGAFKLYKNLIFEIAKENGTPYYDPHITLASPILNLGNSFEDKLIDLGSEFLPLDVELTHIAYERNYFRSLFIKVADNKLLNDLQEVAKTKLKLESEDDFMAHLSIGYGIKNQKVVIEKFKEKISLPHKFKVDKIRLSDTSGKVQYWKTHYELQVRQS